MTRPRMQLHLSTLMIVSLLAAGLVWLNVRTQNVALDITEDSVWIFQVRGWPWVFDYQIKDVGKRWNDVLALDVAVCVALLALAGGVTEWGTRWMTERAQ